uniref:Cytidylyltransferase n=1 Tax=viral metagenome TaxID=1070528 RepID=A0A6M3XGI7_9ZZZZ
MNTTILLTTRYKSTRLPGKHTMKINGHTVTDILIGRLKRCKIPIIMCIPDTPEDVEHMKPIAERNKIGFFAGEPTNIIKRHVDCALANEIDWIILSEGDDFLVCPETINAVNWAIKSKRNKIDCIKTLGLPYGLNVIAYKSEILKDINYNNDTNWGEKVLKNPYELKFNYDVQYRLSMDYEEDFEVMKNVYENCKRNTVVSAIIKYLNKNPEIPKINQKRHKECMERAKKLSV